MKKSYHLKKSVKLFLLFMGLGLIMFLGIWFLINEDKNCYEKIKTECKSHGVEIVTKYTKDGDKYYVCN